VPAGAFFLSKEKGLRLPISSRTFLHLSTTMKVLSHIPAWLKNKYLLTLTAFVVWMIFFDAKDILSQRERTNELKELQESKAYFTAEIARERKALEELRSNPAAIEKYAREKYLMKRENEDLFLVRKAAKQ
jgi:cell division protein DivIC